ncbi:MAG TPA: hypothetical protein VLQ45_33605, partial [Thermoanaerobaculia bacterium]|nr:hypothetical protein [Thermoanaerobaculia bacterium]
LGSMQLCFELSNPDLYAESEACAESLRKIGASLLPMLFSEALPEQCASAWALAGLGACRVWTPSADLDLLGRLFMLWQHSPSAEIRKVAVWALPHQSLALRDTGRWCTSISPFDIEHILLDYAGLDAWSEKPATLILAWYLRVLSDEELAQRTRELLEDTSLGKSSASSRTLRELLEHLGEMRTGIKL